MFGNLFGRNKIIEDKEFTSDFNNAFKRYVGDNESSFQFEFKNKKGEVIPPSHAFIEAYQEWKTIQSVWDRRSVIFSAIDGIYFNKLSRGQVIERYVIDRYPERALVYNEKYSTEEDFTDANLLATLSRCHFILSNYEKSIELAEKALEIEKENKKAQIALADALHLTNHHDKAHEIYERILKNSKLKDWKNDSINVIEVIDFNNDILNSSIYAVGLLSNEKTDESTWDRASEEFYHCPYFRTQHAFWLLKKEKSLKGMAKLIITTQEFPWYKDAIVNAKSGILQMREQMNTNDLWESELTYLNEIINKNNW
ncbi:MAG: tetratricopeptide repeat protein [Crocinitomix sp.]|nr:tetratricopeptide repeat protein [Crocinitomix sp.]